MENLQVEKNAVPGSFLQICHAIPPGEERTGCSHSGRSHAEPQALSKATTQEAD